MSSWHLWQVLTPNLTRRGHTRCSKDITTMISYFMYLQCYHSTQKTSSSSRGRGTSVRNFREISVDDMMTGNDIVIIIFQEGETVYKPTTISSRQVQVVFLVKPVHIVDRPTETFYRYVTRVSIHISDIKRVGVVRRDGVQEFSPKIPDDVIFRQDDIFLEWMYSKLLNAERSCYNAPILNNKLTRTRTSMLKDIATNFT